MIIRTGDVDFDADNRTLFFEIRNTSSRLCVDIDIIGDVIYEGDEQFLVTFGNLPSDQAEVGAIGQACVTILDDDS